MYIPGVSSSVRTCSPVHPSGLVNGFLKAEVQELKNMNAMLDAMTEQELEHPETLHMPARERIAAAAGKVGPWSLKLCS